jgi:Ycf66 protein N-terminus
MVNFGLNSASVLGLFLAVAGASLYFLRSVRPELSRDQDIFFAAVGLLCGLILLFQGWRLDPILQFGQFLLTGSTIFFAVEAIRMRGVATEQARRNTPIVDDERPVSRVYRAELDKLEPYEDEDQYDNPRLRGYQDPRSRKSTEESSPRRSSRNRSSDPYNDYNSSPRSRRPRSSSSTDNYGYSQGSERADLWDDDRPTTETRRRSPRPESGQKPTRKPRPSGYSEERRKPRNEDIPTADYVDYQPINNPDNENLDQDNERDNPINFDY